MNDRNSTETYYQSLGFKASPAHHICESLMTEEQAYDKVSSDKGKYEALTIEKRTYSGASEDKHGYMYESLDTEKQAKSEESLVYDKSEDSSTGKYVYDEVRPVEHSYEDLTSKKSVCDTVNSEDHTYEALSAKGGDGTPEPVVTFTISIIPTDYSKKLKMKKKSIYLLKCETKRLVMLEKRSSKELFSWNFDCIRRFHSEGRKHVFGFEAGRSSTYGTGVLEFKVEHDFDNLVERIRTSVGL